MAEIVFTTGAFAGQQLELPETGIILGKGEGSDLILDDGMVSSKHAQVRMEEGVWCVFDLDSTNGTVVNGEETKAAHLHTGDTVTIGDTSFVFQGNGEAPEGVLASPEAASEGYISVEEAVQAGEVPAEPVQETAVEAPGEEPEPVIEAIVAEPAPVIEAPAVITESKTANSGSALSTSQATEEDVELVKKMSELTVSIRHEIGKVIVGQVEMVDRVLMCMIAGGHALLIGLPGMAKTLTVMTIAQVLDMGFKRVQFTPDLMPTDIVGSDVIETNAETGEKEFRFIKGPIFCNLLLADEINRTPPKTQAALLEAMQEKQVSAGNTTYKLDAPFFVLATQNPIEQEGTYPLPEAQLDRFMFNIWVDYPLQHEEEQIIGATTTGGLQQPQRILTREQVIQLQKVVKKIPVSDHVVKYVVKLVRATRPQYEETPEIIKKFIGTGAGPRACQNLIMAAKARAVLDGRIHVSCADIRESMEPVMRHRLQLNFAADSEGLKSTDIVTQLLELVSEPGEADYAARPAAAPARAVAAPPAQAKAAATEDSKGRRIKRKK